MSTITSLETVPKVRLETVLPGSVVRFTAGHNEGRVGIVQPSYEWSAGARVLIVADGSYIHVSLCAFVQVIA